MGLTSKIYKHTGPLYEAWSRHNAKQKHRPSPVSGVATTFRKKTPVMVFHPIDKTWQVFDAYDIKDKLKSFRFRWDPSGKYWFTADERAAVKAIRWANDETRARLLARFAS